MSEKSVITKERLEEVSKRRLVNWDGVEDKDWRWLIDSCTTLLKENDAIRKLLTKNAEAYNKLMELALTYHGERSRLSRENQTLKESIKIKIDICQNYTVKNNELMEENKRLSLVEDEYKRWKAMLNFLLGDAVKERA